MIGWFLACAEPPAGTLRGDVEGLAKRMRVPTATRAVRWYMQAAPDARGKPAGRADARVYAWLTVDANGEEELSSWLGPSVGEKAVWIPLDVAKKVFPAARLATSFTASPRGYPSVGRKYAAEEIGLDDYRGAAVVWFEDGLYVSLIAR